MITVKEYLSGMQSAVKKNGLLIKPDTIYSGIEGHRRLAREIGFALNDFNKKDQEEILHKSYSTIYVIGCNLKPLLDAKEWISIMKSAIR